MKKLVKGLLISVSEGITIGLLISVLFNYIYQNKYFLPSSPDFVNKFNSPLNALIISIIIWAAMGMIFYFASYIFELEKISVTKQTIYHFLVTYIGYTILTIYAGWYPLNIKWITIYTGIYILVYLFFWLSAMKEARKITDEINQLT